MAEGRTPWFGGQGSSGSVKLLGGEDFSLVAVLHFGRAAGKFVTGKELRCAVCLPLRAMQKGCEHA